MSGSRVQDEWLGYAAFPPMRYETHFGGRVVRCFSERPASLYEMFERGLAQGADREALVIGGRRLTYGELDGLIARAAGGLRSKGIAEGDRVGLLLPNCLEYPILLFAVAKIGAIGVPLNIREAAPELAHILGDCGASAVIHCETLGDRVPRCGDLAALKLVQALDLGTDVSLRPLLEADAVLMPAPVAEEDVAVILYTSGTTGRPKGAMLAHINLAHSVLHYRHAMEVTSDDRSVIAVPMSHVTGLVALILPILSAGATLIVMGEFKADRFIAIAATERMTHTLLVPAMFALCLLGTDVAERDLSAWRVSGYGGAIMPEATLDRIDKILPALRLINCYGATETSSPAVMMPPVHASARAHQVGLPVPCGDIRVMDANGREVAPGEDGEIWISGPMVVPGYWNNPEATAREFTGGYWRSGDAGRADELGYIQIVDRLKDVINRGGYKIYASEVENLLLKIDGVQEVAVVARSCPVLGERVHAFIVGTATDAEELAAFCREQIAQYKQPERYHFVDALPRNANGKVLKRELRARIENED